MRITKSADFVGEDLTATRFCDKFAVCVRPTLNSVAHVAIADASQPTQTNVAQVSSMESHRPAEKVLEDLARYSGDPWRPKSVWWQRAETGMPALWESLIWPFISDCDFSNTLDLAAGHGRNSAHLVKHAKRLIIMDIQPGNVEACRKRFTAESANIEFVVNNGYDMQPVKDASLSLVYCFDSMVHFDSDVVRSYLRDTRRVLAPGGRGFFHHSNSTLHSDWKQDPNGRNFMTAEFFKHYAEKEGLTVVRQKVIDWAKRPNLDCLTLVERQN